MTDQLTDADRAAVRTREQCLCAACDRQRRMIAIIDAHEAERATLKAMNAHVLLTPAMLAALQAQMRDFAARAEADRAALVKERDEAQQLLRTEKRCNEIRVAEKHRAEAEVARLTAERATLKAMNATQSEDLHAVSVENKRLTEALAAECKASSEHYARAEAAEQKLAEAEQRIAELAEDRHRLAGERNDFRRQVEAAEQKLAAAEQFINARLECWKTEVRRANADEARVRELENTVNNECSLRVQATDAAFALQAELAQLRERVAKALAVLTGSGTSQRLVSEAREVLRNA